LFLSSIRQQTFSGLQVTISMDLVSLQISGQQCMLVCNKLLETQGTLELLQRELPDEETSSPDVGQATQELVQVLTRAYETFFKECFCNEWMESALRQHGDLKETASGILYDLQWYRLIYCVVSISSMQDKTIRL
jgi:hypothetical protein